MNLVFITIVRLTDVYNYCRQNMSIQAWVLNVSVCTAGKQSNYDTDIFQSLIHEIESISQIIYGDNKDSDMAMRVIADHLRAVCFTIADGQLPSNNGAGYVIRRILRRAVRYGFTFLNFEKPFLTLLVDKLVTLMGTHFPELKRQQTLIERILLEEEQSFLRTLSQGIQKFEQYIQNHPQSIIDGQFAFELFDTYGFPIDLTRLMAEEKGLTVDMEAFHAGLQVQKQRSRAVASLQTDDGKSLCRQLNQPFLLAMICLKFPAISLNIV